MPETLETLVKLAEDKVEKAQQVVARLTEAIMACDARILGWERDMAVNGVLALTEGDPLLLNQSAAHTQRLRGLIAKTRDDIAVLTGEKAKAMEVLRGCYSEQKRYEILLAKQRLEKKRELSRKQQVQLDEIGGQLVERRKRDY